MSHNSPQSVGIQALPISLHEDEVLVLLWITFLFILLIFFEYLLPIHKLLLLYKDSLRHLTDNFSSLLLWISNKMQISSSGIFFSFYIIQCLNNRAFKDLQYILMAFKHPSEQIHLCFSSSPSRLTFSYLMPALCTSHTLKRGHLITLFSATSFSVGSKNYLTT